MKDYSETWLKWMFFFRNYCHQKPERSFHYHGYQYPVCARCTGLYLGYVIGLIFGLITIVLSKPINEQFLLLAIIPIFIDGGLQYVFKLESNNTRRFITGLLGGIAFMCLCINLINYLFLK
ncbi:MAG: DUF2085 domain-containing protein [Mycoplasmatales bacterium]